MRSCGNCGSLQGPFSVLRLGGRTNGFNVYTCQPGKSKALDEARKPVIACLKRRADRDDA